LLCFACIIVLMEVKGNKAHINLISNVEDDGPWTQDVAAWRFQVYFGSFISDARHIYLPFQFSGQRFGANSVHDAKGYAEQFLLIKFSNAILK